MNTIARKSLAAAAVLAVACVAMWLWHRAAQPLQMELRFDPFVGSEPLEFNEARFANPGGTGRFSVRDFRLFISNIRLIGESGDYIEPDSYHLLRFDGAEPGFAIALRDVPRRDYERIEFGIGVDAAANGSIAVRGDLDPNGRMAWTWDVGYKFVLFEGELSLQDGERIPLVYHVGFDENYRQFAFPLEHDLLASSNARIDFRVDLLDLFAGDATIDMAELSNVKFDRTDAARLAGNYASMIKMGR